MILAFVIWTLAALLFLGLGLYSRKSPKAVGFFANAQPPEVTDVKVYNRAVSRIWFVFGTLFEALGLPFLFAEQNSPIFIFLTLGVVFLVIGTVLAYVLTLNRCQKKR